MSTLILHLPLALPGPHTEYRYTLSLDGHSASGHASAPAPLLPAANETVAVVPARALSCQRVPLPHPPVPPPPPLRAVPVRLMD